MRRDCHIMVCKSFPGFRIFCTVLVTHVEVSFDRCMIRVTFIS